MRPPTHPIGSRNDPLRNPRPPVHWLVPVRLPAGHAHGDSDYLARLAVNDLSRVLVANQTHRRMIDPMSFRRWDKPFWIQRADDSAASVPTANDPSAHAEASMGQGVSK